MNSVFLFYRFLFSFRGRTSRRDYWISIFFHTILLLFLFVLLTPFVGHKNVAEYYNLWVLIFIISIQFYMLFIIIGIQSIYFRRMRDAGQKNSMSIGLFILNLIPYVQIFTRIYTIYLLSQPSVNNYQMESISD